MNLLNALVPELALVITACVLFLLGATKATLARQAAPWIAMAAMMFGIGRLLGIGHLLGGGLGSGSESLSPSVAASLTSTGFTHFVRVLALAIGMLLTLLHWPTDKLGSRNNSLELGRESPEYFGLLLLSLTGLLLVAGANDLITLFLGIELSSLPTYVMISISRPLPAAQEAAVKYFFLGAFSAALTLLGLTFIFGTTGASNLTGVTRALWVPGGGLATSGWLVAGGVLVILGLAFKMAAFPLHFYAPDVYTGAATPMTAFLSFVPKTAGIIALIRVLFALSGGMENHLPHLYMTLLWVMAVASMTIGNVLGLMQHNIKRMMACSSIAHSGYMLAGVAIAFGEGMVPVRESAVQGVLFYLVAYGLMNVGVFAVLMMLPARPDPFVYDGRIPPATSAETLGDIAGTGRRNPGIGLAMAICCFSLIGIPLTVGFAGKLFLIRPALQSYYIWLSVIMVINAAISAGYYLRIVTAMFLKAPRAEPAAEAEAAAVGESCPPDQCMRAVPLMLACVLSAGATLFLGAVVPATTIVRSMTRQAVEIQTPLRANPEQRASAQPLSELPR